MGAARKKKNNGLCEGHEIECQMWEPIGKKATTLGKSREKNNFGNITEKTPTLERNRQNEQIHGSKSSK